MDLRKFPLDSQNCPLNIGSFGYSAEDIVYSWAKPKAVSIDKLGLAQFHLTRYETYEKISVTNRRTRISWRNDSVAHLDFFFERQTGFFLLQIYTPLNLIVFCSWVAFWLIKTEKGGEVPARTALGATSVLSVVNIGFGGKSRPHVPYATALDVFIILCFIAVFAALVEFACTNFLDTFVKRKKQRAEVKEKELREKTEEIRKLQEEKVAKAMEVMTLPLAVEPKNPFAEEGPPLATVEDEFEDVEEEDTDDPPLSTPQKLLRFCKSSFYNVADFLFLNFETVLVYIWGPIEDMNFYQNPTEVIWTIDSYARICFPLVFLIIQTSYWAFYLYLT